MFDLYLLLALLVVGYLVGSFLERRHYKSIIERERDTLRLPVLTAEFIDESDYESLGLVGGSAVISVDYFKRFVAGLRNLFGGRVSTYESLLDRARREAVLRMKAQCPTGTEAVMNMRLETAAVGAQHIGRRNGIACLEVFAYGTAVRKIG